jgi:hypothetical protein
LRTGAIALDQSPLFPDKIRWHNSSTLGWPVAQKSTNRAGRLQGGNGRIKETTMTRHWLMIAATIFIVAAIPSTAHGAEMPANWDGLAAVKAKRADAVYLLPGADFRPYTKVMFDPTEAAMKKDYRRNYNRGNRDLSRQISETDIQKALDMVRTQSGESFTKAYTAAGYQVVTTPGPDVLRMKTAIINLDVKAPDIRSSSRTRSLSEEAGQATLVLEARDSMTGTLMGRALDRRYAGDNSMWLRNSVTNKGDFTRLFNTWAKESAEGLSELKSLSAVSVASTNK